MPRIVYWQCHGRHGMIARAIKLYIGSLQRILIFCSDAFCLYETMILMIIKHIGMINRWVLVSKRHREVALVFPEGAACRLKSFKKSKKRMRTKILRSHSRNIQELWKETMEIQRTTRITQIKTTKVMMPQSRRWKLSTRTDRLILTSTCMEQKLSKKMTQQSKKPKNCSSLMTIRMAACIGPVILNGMRANALFYCANRFCWYLYEAVWKVSCF
mmetsp:Transcript_2150/g.3438  ORF Transcript_2150/g.3438 Transcript_2150/m.3438 type:complete len:215 (+) Transcript_2150:930-1574(+)